MTPCLRYYVLFIIIVAPVFVCVVVDAIIFRSIRASFRRIQPSGVLTTMHHSTAERSKLSRRDIHLLRHMIVMLTVFVAGWGPIYITSILMNHVSINSRLSRSFALLADISLIFDIIDLFLYSHKLRHYLQRSLLPSCCG
jgi:hypothetical protein